MVAGSLTSVLLLGPLLSIGSAATGSEAWVNGNTKATAIVARLAPGVGSLQLAVTAGSAVSETRNQLAQAQSQALDLGLIGTTLTAESCSGAPLRPDQLPQPLRVDNRRGEASAQEDEAPVANRIFGGGRKQVAATKQPMASASVTGVASALDPVLRIWGGRADAETKVVPGRSREAHATTTASVDILGLVQLRGLRWEALHRTGADPVAEATFSLGSLGGMEAPVDLRSLEAVEDVVNTALAITGISIDMPQVVRLKRPADLVRVTPLRILIKDSPLGAALLGPLLSASREQREQMFDQLSAAICQASGLLLVGDIGLSVLSGTGFLAVEVGGAEATTAEVRYEDPFGAVGGRGVVGGDAVSGGGTPLGDVGAGAGTSAPGGARVRGSLASGPTDEVCETVHPFGWPGCSRGAALPIGLAGLGATATAAFLDWRHQRRRLAEAA